MRDTTGALCASKHPASLVVWHHESLLSAFWSPFALKRFYKDWVLTVSDFLDSLVAFFFVVVLLFVYSLSCIQLFATPWMAAHQAPRCSTVSQSLLRFMSIELVSYLTTSSSAAPFFCLQSFPALGSFLMSWLFVSAGQSIGASASVSDIPMNIQGWFPLGLMDLISLQSKGLSRVFCRLH